ncbi:MAG: type II secretion system protein [Lachnospiraceae bacterium]|nr:type II secretion system protein [Lachnospiraceae bacterium]
MRNGKRYRIQGKAGTTLVEMVVAMLLFSLMGLIIIGALSPAAKQFVRMQKLQFARVILDNTTQELRAITQDATEYVKIYANCVDNKDIIGKGTDPKNGVDEGLALEFVNTQGYVVLLSTQGCGKTTIIRGGKKTGQTIEEQPEGRLLTRYYAPPGGENRLYYYTDVSTDADLNKATPVARAVSSVFTEGYYMGNYLKVTFSYPKDASGNYPAPGAAVNYLVADVALYSDEDLTDLVVKDRVILDFRYSVKRRDVITAKPAPDPLESN